MKAKQKGEGNFKPIPAGMHTAVCVGLIDLGLQAGNNPKFAPAIKLALIFRTPDQLTDSGEPMSITAKLTCSMHKKANLRKIVENWFGKSFPDEETAENFDLKHLLGRAALINVKHDTKNDKTYANIAAVNPLPAAIPKPVVPAEDLIFYDGDMTVEQKNAVWDRIPEWLQKLITEQLQPKAAPAGGGEQPAREPGSDDDIPW
jgi:hypothetical protein